MGIREEYLSFREINGLKTNKFQNRVKLQLFLRDRLSEIWNENPKFMNGGLLSNYMTKFSLGFAYYDCKPTSFCKEKCYGLPISGLHDFYMLRLGVITSESLKTYDQRFIIPLLNFIKVNRLKYIKIGHWGDAVKDQVPSIAKLAICNPETFFWWYTKKIDVAIAANNYYLPNLKAYLSLEPQTTYPKKSDYPFGITYFLSEYCYNQFHNEILNDKRLVAIFTLKKGKFIEDHRHYGIQDHPKLCEDKKLRATFGSKCQEICLFCSNR